MPKTFVLSLDDSGTRHPDKKQGRVPEHGNDWFALGGILFDEDDETKIRAAHAEFSSRWKINKPLHSVEIRAMSSNFAFLGAIEEVEQKRFYEDLYQLMKSVPVVGHACVIDRPKYNERYAEKYGNEKWQLCKSAFAIVCERAAKIANSKGAKLRVQVERSDRKTDQTIRSYYDDLRQNGAPFAKATSEKYEPATADMMSTTLYEFRVKAKSSPLMQLADLYLWPICMGGYNKNCRPYKRLFQDSKIVDATLAADELQVVGVKYYCF